MGAPEHITDTDITDALTALPDITAAEVAGALGIGRSTAAKRLARLEAAGTIRRNPGGRSGGARIADRWSLATPAPETRQPQGATSEDLAATSGEAVSAPEPDPSDPGTGRETRSEPAGDASERLAPGALGALVREYLAARPGQSFGPSGIGKALGRSAGAVSNALSTMVAAGEVQLVAERPRRYRIASSD
ncbi:MAG: winged helix-turn-helix domain-containing protein [Actinomycetota bacterium]|nr:winged helix-turn-helix domain-containing protein [Actinomycetota bacterium]MDA8076511.1 winged helix-turn-helix domain-containing protein [Actinomycetota bacterium]MDA8366720.1 winged helix-turn-helix domain-containing protein [Actinomycetota bacterium]